MLCRLAVMLGEWVVKGLVLCEPYSGLFDAGSGGRGSICRAYLTAYFDRTMSAGCLTVGDRSREM